MEALLHVVMVQATSAELVPEQLSGQLVVPALTAKVSVGQLAYEALRNGILAMDVYHDDADLRGQCGNDQLAAQLLGNELCACRLDHHHV